MRTRAIYPALVVFCVAAAGLLLQIVQTRIYAVVFWNHLVYFIVSLALLGFGISGTWLAFGPDTALARFLTLRRSAIAFVLTALLSSLVMPQLGITFAHALNDKFHLLRLLATYSVAVLPYFFAGWMLGVVYRDYADRIHFLYFADLIGAALGCLVVLALLQPLGAVTLVLVACALVAAPVLPASSTTTAGRTVTAAVFIGLIGLFLWSDVINARIVPERSKAFHLQFANLAPDDHKIVELSEWNILARTDVVGTAKTDRKLVMIDGDAYTEMHVNVPDPVQPFDPAKEPLVSHNTPYVLDRAFDSVLVIGSGAGADVHAALRAGADRVDAVEINPTTARIVQDEYNDIMNGLFKRPGVRVWNEEGRSFVRSRPDTYDVVMINAIDTFAATDSGAYMLAENYLYTVDAIKDYVTHLTPKGVLCITRWDYAGESSRLFAVMLEALYELGYSDPLAHIAVQEREDWASVIVSPSPFSPQDHQALRANAEGFGGIVVYPVSAEQQKTPLQQAINGYAQARQAGTQEAFLAGFPYNIHPVHDDSPFFFHYRKASELKKVFRGTNSADYVRGHWSEFTLAALLVMTTVALLLFVGVPLAKRGPAVIPGFKLWLLFFCCLGAAFIFVEISLMQRFALFLGHPARSLALVLAALLFSAGVGSHLKERLGICLKTALALLVVTIAATAYLYPFIIDAMLGQPLWLREVLTVLLVAPLGLLMGMPFPTGIRAVAAESRDAVPWMWGVNGGATVLGSITAVSLAIQYNFTTVLILAAAGYAIALAAYILVTRKAATPTPAPATPKRKLREPVAP